MAVSGKSSPRGVGASPSRRDTWRVYLFDADGHPERVLSPPDLESDDYGFGTSIAVNDWVVVVGGARTGVYVFDATTGDVRLRLANAAAGRDGFGAAVAFSGGTVVVSDPLAGTVDGFDGETGLWLWQRTAPNRRPRAFGFGQPLAGDAGLVAVGGAEDEIVRVLETTNGSLRHRYRAPRPRSGFGAAVAIHGRFLLVGAPGVKEETVVAYLYRLGRARPVAVFRLRGIYRLGSRQSVAFSGDRVLVGAPGADRVGVFARAH